MSEAVSKTEAPTNAGSAPVAGVAPTPRARDRAARYAAVAGLATACAFGLFGAWDAASKATVPAFDASDEATYPFELRTVDGFEARRVAAADLPEGRRYRAAFPTFGRVAEALLTTPPNAVIFVVVSDETFDRFRTALLVSAATPRKVAVWLSKRAQPEAIAGIAAAIDEATSADLLKAAIGVDAETPLFLLDVGETRVRFTGAIARPVAEGPNAALWTIR